MSPIDEAASRQEGTTHVALVRLDGKYTSLWRVTKEADFHVKFLTPTKSRLFVFLPYLFGEPGDAVQGRYLFKHNSLSLDTFESRWRASYAEWQRELPSDRGTAAAALVWSSHNKECERMAELFIDSVKLRYIDKGQAPEKKSEWVDLYKSLAVVIEVHARYLDLLDRESKKPQQQQKSSKSDGSPSKNLERVKGFVQKLDDQVIFDPAELCDFHSRPAPAAAGRL